MTDTLTPETSPFSWQHHMPRLDLERVDSVPVYDALDEDIHGTTVIGGDGCTYVVRSDSFEVCGPIDSDNSYDWRPCLSHPQGMAIALRKLASSKGTDTPLWWRIVYRQDVLDRYNSGTTTSLDCRAVAMAHADMQAD